MMFSYQTNEISRTRRWITFLVGLALDVVGGLLLIAVGTHIPTVVPLQPTARHYVTLIAPRTVQVTRHAPAPSLPALPRVATKLSVARNVALPRIESPAVEPPKVAATEPHANPAPAVKTNVFAAASSETATVHQSPRQVQTGGFGDPNGVAGQGDPKRNTVTVASVGAFDLPSGSGKGNGTGGSHGVSGSVRSAGFGDGAASSSPQVRGNGSVASSGFGDRVAPASSPALQRVQKKEEAQPVEIVFKPRPVYTAEARRRGVEGEVLLEVVFTASGSLRINRVVRGLGYGLDDAALAAAQRIQFRPARRDGEPYDCAALVHIAFELAE